MQPQSTRYVFCPLQGLPSVSFRSLSVPALLGMGVGELADVHAQSPKAPWPHVRWHKLRRSLFYCLSVVMECIQRSTACFGRVLSIESHVVCGPDCSHMASFHSFSHSPFHSKFVMVCRLVWRVAAFHIGRRELPFIPLVDDFVSCNVL